MKRMTWPAWLGGGGALGLWAFVPAFGPAAYGQEPAEGQLPISIVRLDAAILRRKGADTLEEVARSVPNLAVPAVGAFGAQQPTLRGVFSNIGASTIGLYIDDVPVQIRSLEVAGDPDLRSFDLERVEVLRGPQGTLFGANSMGGTIRYLTRQPELTGMTAQASGELAAVKGGGITREFQAAFGSVIVPEKIGVRASAYYRRDAGVIDRLDPATGARVQDNPVQGNIDHVVALGRVDAGADWGGAVIRTEEIYDAAIDDGAFEGLAATLADAVGARSGVLHWGFSPLEVAEISYSGYFSDAQMAVYDDEFQADDIWGTALERSDMVGHAVFTLRPDGTLLDGNRAADAMLRRGDTLMLRQRRVKACDPRDDEAFQTVLRASSTRQSAQAGAIFAHREQGLPYMLSIASVRVGADRQIVAIATDPADRDLSLTSRIRALYGLTRAEAEVAEALCAGRGLEELSQERGVALNTVRTQIKNIYVKLDCSRQSELVARIGALPRLGSFTQE